MDKIKINNQVVSMRKFVKQAKIRVINKYVKEIKLLQNRKGDKNQALKCKRKAERLLSEVAILKKIKPDSVSKMALSKDKDWKAILNQKNASLEDRCFAILANYNPVQKEVEKFHSDNYYLVPKIGMLVQEWEDKAKLTSQSPQKNKKAFKNDKKAFQMSAKKSEFNPNQKDISKIEEKPEIDNKDQNDLEHTVDWEPSENEESDRDVTDKDDSDSASEDADEQMEDDKFSDKDTSNVIVSEKKLAVSEKKLAVSEKESKMIGTDLNSDDTDSSSSELEDGENCSESPQKDFVPANAATHVAKLKGKSVKITPNHTKISSIKTTSKDIHQHLTSPSSFRTDSNSTKAVTLLNLNEMLDLDEIPIESRTTVEAVEESGKRKRDTFFLDDNGKDFSESDDNEDYSDDSRLENYNTPFKKKQHKDFNKKGSFNERFKTDNGGFKNRRNFGNSSHAQKFGFRENNFKQTDKDFHSKGKPNSFGKYRGKQENNFSKSGSKSFEKREGKHENQFNQNKKWNTIDKNDRKDQKSFKNSGKSFERNTTNNKNRSNDNFKSKQESFKAAEKKDERPLHPSWEAKQKLKNPVKAKFQGKRVVFND